MMMAGSVPSPMDLMLDCDISMKEELENMEMDLHSLSSIDLDKELVKLENNIDDFEGLEIENSVITDTGQEVMAWLNSNSEGSETFMVNPSSVIPVTFAVSNMSTSVSVSHTTAPRTHMVTVQPRTQILPTRTATTVPVVNLNKLVVGGSSNSVSVRGGNVLQHAKSLNLASLTGGRHLTIIPSTVNATTVHIPRVQLQNAGDQMISKNSSNINRSKLDNGLQVSLNNANLEPESMEKIYPKPAYSYSCLIAMALKNSNAGSLPVSQIYNFMCQHFPYFKTAPNGWKNSVRHNLSLNKCFEKIEKPSTSPSGSTGSSRKGCLWALNPAKISKMDEEVQKWTRKDPNAIKKAMANPDYLERLEKGEMKIDESSSTRLNCSPLDSEEEDTEGDVGISLPEMTIKTEPETFQPSHSTKLYELLGEDPPGLSGAATLLSDPNMGRTASQTPPPPSDHYCTLYDIDSNTKQIIKVQTSL